MWLGRAQWGKETSFGVLVPATRIMYFTDPNLTEAHAPRPHAYMTGTRDNVRSFTNGPQEVGGAAPFPLSADEIIEPLLIGVQGAVTPTTPANAQLARLWTFKPGASLDSASMEWHDGAVAHAAAGVRANRLTIAGSVGAENTVAQELFAASLIEQALTGSLVDRVPTLIEGWETQLYIDAAGGTPGTTLVSNTLINWNVDLNNNLGRKFFANNTNLTSAVILGNLAITAQLTFEAAASQALTELSNWRNRVRRLVRLLFGQNDVIESATNGVVTATITGGPAGGTFTLTYGGQTTGTIAYNAAASAVQTAVQALSSVGSGNILVTGSAGGPYTLTAAGTLAGTTLTAFTKNASGLTGGTSPDVVIAVVTPGNATNKRFVSVDIPGAISVVNLGANDAGTRTWQMTLQYVYDTALAAGIQYRAQNSRTAAW